MILLLISPFASLKSIDYELEAQETLSIAANDGAVYEQQIHEELLLYFDALLQNDLGINARDIRIDIGIQDGEADKIEILSLYRARTGGRHRAVAAARHGRNGEHDRFRTLVG